MESAQFDRLARQFAQSTSRRSVVAALVGGVAALLHDQARATQRLRAQRGASCVRPTECASFYCVDGHCCDDPCTGQCEACDLSGQEGTCLPVTGAAVGNRPACPGAEPCQGTYDGANPIACAFPEPGVACGEPTCTDGWLTTYACAGNGTCAPETTACDSSVCDATGTACLRPCAVHADCADGNGCTVDFCGDTQCLTLLVDNCTPCGMDAECNGGICCHGRCCDAGERCEVDTLGMGLCCPNCQGSACCDAIHGSTLTLSASVVDAACYGDELDFCCAGLYEFDPGDGHICFKAGGGIGAVD